MWIAKTTAIGLLALLAAAGCNDAGADTQAAEPSAELAKQSEAQQKTAEAEEMEQQKLGYRKTQVDPDQAQTNVEEREHAAEMRQQAPKIKR